LAISSCVLGRFLLMISEIMVPLAVVILLRSLHEASSCSVWLIASC
jgi:hypothetical protein